MGLLRSAARGALSKLAERVAKDGLFEKPGERPPTGRLPDGAAPKAAPAPAAPKAAPPPPAAPKAEAVKAPPAPKAEAPAPPPPVPPGDTAAARPAAKRPAEGCAPVDVAGLLAALVPAGRPLVVNHWATWCDPCVEELPRLVRAAAGLGAEAEFLGVSWDLFDHPAKPATAAKKVAKFADGMGVGYPSVLFTGEPEALFRACGLDHELIPQTLVLAPDGRVVWHHTGMLTDDDVFPLVAAARAAKG